MTYGKREGKSLQLKEDPQNTYLTKKEAIIILCEPVSFLFRSECREFIADPALGPCTLKNQQTTVWKKRTDCASLLFTTWSKTVWGRYLKLLSDPLYCSRKLIQFQVKALYKLNSKVLENSVCETQSCEKESEPLLFLSKRLLQQQTVFENQPTASPFSNKRDIGDVTIKKVRKKYNRRHHATKKNSTSTNQY